MESANVREESSLRTGYGPRAPLFVSSRFCFLWFCNQSPLGDRGVQRQQLLRRRINSWVTLTRYRRVGDEVSRTCVQKEWSRVVQSCLTLFQGASLWCSSFPFLNLHFVRRTSLIEYLDHGQILQTLPFFFRKRIFPFTLNR
ncbi:hypothetical protein K445DRAFT_288249 [Daldinia sp. EC12]|nr:hypothetical protein K445DRAFT_288249 [Daldinia sp. EC12]